MTADSIVGIFVDLRVFVVPVYGPPTQLDVEDDCDNYVIMYNLTSPVCLR